MASRYIQLFIFCVAFISAAESHQQGFTIDLIHRDSPNLSSLPDSTFTSNNLLNDINRSFTRARQIQATISPKAAAPIIPTAGAYVIDASIGTPPKRFLGAADTGSDLTWTQCKPCRSCFKQSIPIFYPKESSTYAKLPCNSAQCRDLPRGQFGCYGNTSCTYVYSYGDDSTTTGDLSTDTLTIDPQNSVSNFSFGCGRLNEGKFRSDQSGVIGLGQGPLSLVSQTRDIPAFDGKFAYCLVPRNIEVSGSAGNSKISFGKNAVVSGPGVVSTPTVQGGLRSFYYLTLEGISVGGNEPSAFGSAKGNIIIDSGTALTFLPDEFYQNFASSLKSAIKAEPVTPGPRGVNLCYESKVDIPNVTFRFEGADLELTPVNTFVEVGGGVKCLSVVSSSTIGVAIFGNLAQVNFLIGYDLAAQKVSFKPIDCTKYE